MHVCVCMCVCVRVCVCNRMNIFVIISIYYFQCMAKLEKRQNNSDTEGKDFVKSTVVTKKLMPPFATTPK